MRNAYKNIVRKREGKKSLGRLRRRWEDNIKVILKKEGGSLLTGFSYLADERNQWLAIVNMVMNFRVP
jgi:hypothetical protein